MTIGTKVFIKSMNKTGVVIDVDGFPYGRIPLNWPFVKINNYGHPYRLGEYFDPKDLEVILKRTKK